MAWAASTLYLHDTADARAVLLSSSFASHVFALDVKQLEHGPALAEGASGHLLAIRSPARPSDSVPSPFSWAPLDGTLRARLGPLRSKLTGANSRLAAPDAALRWMEDLAARVAGPVSWYQAEADHGDPHAELSWVIDHGGPTTLRFGGEDVPINRGPALHARQDWRFWRFDEAGKSMVKDPLAMALLHLGVRLDTPFFLPHSDVFDWSAHALAPG